MFKELELQARSIGIYGDAEEKARYKELTEAELDRLGKLLKTLKASEADAVLAERNALLDAYELFLSTSADAEGFTDVYKEKKWFTEVTFARSLFDAVAGLKKVQYNAILGEDEKGFKLAKCEYVILSYEGGGDEKIYVTYDSKLALMRDVLRGIE